MKALHDRILRDGRCLNGGILKVDSFVNHQIDPILMKQMAGEFARRFADCGANKIMTIEASGIAPAIMTSYEMRLPMVFAKKAKPSTMADHYEAVVHSFTKQCDYTLVVSRNFLTSADRVLFIDDFLAFGNSALAAAELCRQAGAEIVGMGFVIEKEFQHGRQALFEAGHHRLESLAIIESLEDNKIRLKQ